MNRTVVFITFAAVTLAAIIGITVIIVVRPDAVATLINATITLLAVLSTFAATAHQLNKVNEKVAQVEKQTNGTLSKKDQEIQELQALLRVHYDPKKAEDNV